ncbi:MAG TPA: hypothetical protein VFV87_20025 [Pirellulaceae bacterium]|nr:hypothetical protein [Pirellulaceae bacterium]
MFRFTIRELLLAAALVAVCCGWAGDRWLHRPQRYPLGLDGYCPVTLVETSRWKAGNPRLAAVHEGQRYLLAGPEELQLFEQSPERYAPVSGGADLVRLVDEQKRTAGRREHGLFTPDGIYLFDSEETLERFSANPKKYAASAVSSSPPSQPPVLK